MTVAADYHAYSFCGSGGTELWSYDYTYDNYGNRTVKQYCNGGSILEKYNWTRGRFLSSITNGSNNTIASYEYNADGVRYSKTVNGVTTTFYYNGNTLMGEDRKSAGNVIKRLRYSYDREGICGFRYYDGEEWKTYTYIKNAQGDVIIIKDENGVARVRYEYEPFGHVRKTTTSNRAGDTELAKLNPFRYRGYYYDEESGLYYLITRYYDPYEGIFISPDSFEYLDPTKIGGVNLYAYCNNNPVMTKQSLALNNLFKNSNYIKRQYLINSSSVQNSNNINWFGHEYRTSIGWDYSKLLVNSLFRIGISDYETHTEGNSGVFYYYSGETTDVMNIFGKTYYGGIGLNLANTFGMEMQLEFLGISGQVRAGRFSCTGGVNLFGSISITIGWDTYLENGNTNTKGFTIGINAMLVMSIALFLYKLFTTGDPSPLPA